MEENMKSVLLCMAVLLLSIFVSSCAGFSVYSDQDLKHESGIPILRSKPYLFVKRNIKKDEPLEATIIYIKDPEKAYYLVPKSGFGTSKLSFKLTDGELTEFGQDIDAKIPETIDKLTGSLTAYGTITKTLAEAGKINAETKNLEMQEQSDQMFLSKKAPELIKLTNNLFESLGRMTKLTKEDQININTSKKKIFDLIDKIVDPANNVSAAKDAESLSLVVDTLQTQITDQQSNNLIKVYNADIKKLLGIEIKKDPKENITATFELYEIIIKSDMTILKRVNIDESVSKK